MTWLISDANIIIDMEAGEILEKMFMLHHQFAVPNVLYAEELSEQHPELPILGLTILDVREEFVDEAYRLGDIYKQPSHNDLLALALAKQEECPLLTGDGKLREAATNELVEVCGTLWIMESLYTNKILDYKSIEEAYGKMKVEERRLPWTEVEHQLKGLKK